jgi:hypothetical protein
MQAPLQWDLLRYLTGGTAADSIISPDDSAASCPLRGDNTLPQFFK